MAVKTFEQYLAEWQADARPLRDEPYEKCDNCGGPHPVTRDGVCRECLHYFHGHDEAHDKLVDSIVGSAVKRALEAGGSPEQVTLAVQRAIKRRHEEETDAALLAVARTATAGGG